MGQQLNMAAALGTLHIIADYTSADFDSLGIHIQDFKLVNQNTPWIRDNRRRVIQTLDALLFGTLDQMGQPRFAVPAEYVAAVLLVFVQPVNRMVACSWMAEARMTGPRAIDLATQGIDTGEVDPVAASQLLGLIVSLTGAENSSEVYKRFESRMAERTKKAMEPKR